MKVELLSTRREFLKRSAATGITLSLYSYSSMAESGNEIAEANDVNQELPTFFSPTEIHSDSAVLGTNTENDGSKYAEKEFSFIPYKSSQMPTDWEHQPGLAFNKEIDFFLGGYVANILTEMWAYSTPVEIGTTPEEIVDDIVTKIRHDQRQQFEQNPDPMPWDLYGEPNTKFDQEIAGIDNGWSIITNMPNFTRPNYHHFHYGFLKDENAYLFNLTCSWNPFNESENEAGKFADMIAGLKEK